MKQKSVFHKYLNPASPERKLHQRIYFGVLIIACIAVIALLLMLILGKSDGKEAPTKNFETAKKNFTKEYAQNNETWFQENDLLPDNVVAIDFDSSRLIYQSASQKKYIHYTNLTDNCVKRVTDTSFRTFLSGYLDASFLKGEESLMNIAVSIGADTTYVNEIDKHRELSQEDRIFSLIYNTIAGDDKGHYAVTIRDKKLCVFRTMTFDKIDKEQFLKTMQEESLSARERYILAKADVIRKSGGKQTQDEKAFMENSLLKECRFLYLDIRNDKLQIGSERHSLTAYPAYVQQLKSCPEGIFYLPPGSAVLYRLTPDDLCGNIDMSKINADKTQGSLGKEFFLLRTLGHPVLVWIAVAVLMIFVALTFWMMAKSKSGQKVSLTFVLPTDDKGAPASATDNPPVKLKLSINKSLPAILSEMDAATGSKFSEQWSELEKEGKKAAEKKREYEAAHEREMSLVNAKLKTKEKTIQQLKEEASDLQSEMKKNNKRMSEMEEKFEEVKESAHLLDGTRRVMEDFAKRCSVLHPGSPIKEQLEWERLAITLHAYDAVCALVEVWLEQFPNSTFTTKAQWSQALQRENFVQIAQSDTMVLSKLKEFVNCLNNKNKADTTDLNSRISGAIGMYYNTLSTVARITLPDNKRLDDVMSSAVHAQRAADAGSLFIDSMWNNFVHEFATEKISEHSQDWYFEHIVNIAYHAIDYVLIKQGQPDNQCANYQFLKSGFRTDIPQCRPFESGHAEKSSTDSQLVYTWMDELGVKHLKVLIDGYLIKP